MPSLAFRKASICSRFSFSASCTLVVNPQTASRFRLILYWKRLHGGARGQYLLHSCARNMANQAEALRTRLYDNPEGKFVHNVVLDSCRQHAAKVAVVDTSCTPARRITYAAYGEMVERAARGLVAAGIRPGEMIGIYLPNCWEFAIAYHAATMAGAVPTTMNPTYREREVHYQLETAEAVALISDGALLTGIDLSGLPALRNVYTIRK